MAKKEMIEIVERQPFRIACLKKIATSPTGEKYSYYEPIDDAAMQLLVNAERLHDAVKGMTAEIKAELEKRYPGSFPGRKVVKRKTKRRVP